MKLEVPSSGALRFGWELGRKRTAGRAGIRPRGVKVLAFNTRPGETRQQNAMPTSNRQKTSRIDKVKIQRREAGLCRKILTSIPEQPIPKTFRRSDLSLCRSRACGSSQMCAARWRVVSGPERRKTPSMPSKCSTAWKSDARPKANG